MDNSSNPIIAISASVRFKKKIMELEEGLKSVGKIVYFPILDLDLPPECINEDKKCKLVLDFFNKIDQCSILYVLNPDGYIGLSVAMEIGYAYAKKKQIIAQNKEIDIGIKPLIAQYLNESEFISHLKNSKFNFGPNF
jgi:hypothetical protein